MSAHVLFNLVNFWGKVTKCEAYRAFPQQVNKFNKTGA